MNHIRPGLAARAMEEEEDFIEHYTQLITNQSDGTQNTRVER